MGLVATAKPHIKGNIEWGVENDINSDMIGVTNREVVSCTVFEQSEEKSEVFFLKSELLAMTVQ